MIKSLFYLLIFAYSGFFNHSEEHALYLSVVQIDHQEMEQEAEIKIKVFTDDFQDAMRNAFAEYQVGPLNSFCTQNGKFIQEYIHQHLEIKVNQQPTQLELTQCTLEGEVFLFTFSMHCPKKWEKVHINADLLMELFPTQTNVFNLFSGDERRFFRLQQKAPSIQLTL